MVIPIAAAAVALIALIVAWQRFRPARRFALHMKGGMPTITGVIVRRGPRRFVLIAAELEQDADSTHTLGGHVEVLRENVFCLQEIK